MKSSRSISPGWIGRRCMGLVFGIAMIALPLMVVTDLDVIGITIGEAKANTPLVIDGDCMLALAISLQRVKPVPRWHPQVVESRREVDVLELAERPRQDVRRKPLRDAGREELLCAAIGERLDHRGM